MEYITPERIARDTVYHGGGTYRVTDTPLGLAFQQVTAGTLGTTGDVWAVGHAHGIPAIETDLYGIREAVGTMADDVAGLTGHGVVGTWIDPDTGRAYIDAVELIAERENALALAAYYGELAVYNITTGETVSIDRTPATV